MKQKMGAIFVATVAAGLLASCGGGGGGETVVTPPPVVLPDPVIPPIVLSLEDPFTFVLGGTDGLWNFEGGGGGGGGDGGGDGGGGGGDGEFIKVRMKFPTLTIPTGSLTWTVLRSQFGIDKNTGTLTIVKDTSGQGGYKVTEVNGSAAAVRPNQANFFVSTSGQLSGSFPLPIGVGGAVKDSQFSGIRFKDATSTASDLSEYAGTYLYGGTGRAISGGPVQVEKGSLRINADGSGRFCPNVIVWSATCVGLDVMAKFDDPSNRNLVRIVEAKVQSLPIPADVFTKIDALAVFRKFGLGGVAVSVDTVGQNAAGVKFTVASYASRQGSAPLNPALLVGAWNNKDLFGNSRVSVANVGGVIKARGGRTGGTGCEPDSFSLVAGPEASVISIFTSSGVAEGSKLTQLDADLVIIVSPDNLNILRRYSTDPTKAPCQPI